MKTLKFKAIYNNIEINDGDYFNPFLCKTDKNNSNYSNSYPCIVCSHGILWTNKILKDNDYINIVKGNLTETYYKEWEGLNLLSKDVIIEQIIEN